MRNYGTAPNDLGHNSHNGVGHYTPAPPGYLPSKGSLRLDLGTLCLVSGIHRGDWQCLKKTIHTITCFRKLLVQNHYKQLYTYLFILLTMPIHNTCIDCNSLTRRANSRTIFYRQLFSSQRLKEKGTRADVIIIECNSLTKRAKIVSPFSTTTFRESNIKGKRDQSWHYNHRMQ